MILILNSSKLYRVDNFVGANQICSNKFRVVEPDQDDVGGVKVDRVFQGQNLFPRQTQRLKA